MLPKTFSIRDDFPAADYAAWRDLVEAELQGGSFERLVTHTYEGIDIQPVYTDDDRVPPEELGLPGVPPYLRGSDAQGPVDTGWDLRQEHATPDLVACNRAILEDLQGGVTSVLLRLDVTARNGSDADVASDGSTDNEPDGVVAYTLNDFEQVFSDVDLSAVRVALESGAAYLPATALLAALCRHRKISQEQIGGALNCDPLGALARSGHLPMSADEAFRQVADVVRWTKVHCPQVQAIGVETDAYHRAGATAAQDIAFAMATGLEYLRSMTDHDLSLDDAANAMIFRFSLGTHHFLAIAKLRAARLLWHRIVTASGGAASAAAMRIHARTSERVLTRRDPYVNLLRNTVSLFAACMGGADAITSVPFDVTGGPPDAFSRRIARNSLLILQEESHLHRVLDPAGGSWFLDRLTEDVADVAWGIFQEVERQGGMLKALQSGWIASQIDAAYAPRAKDIARRKEGITGVSEFPNVAEEPVRHAAVDPGTIRKSAATRLGQTRTKKWDNVDLATANDRVERLIEAALQGATLGQLARAAGMHRGDEIAIDRLEPHSFAGPFEELRDASDKWKAVHGKRPTVFLANMGPVSHHLARATYSKNFFEAGGFEVVSPDGFKDATAAASAFAASGATIGVICSSDKLYPEVVPAVAPALKQAGARSVVLAGNPGANEPAWREVGVDRFIYMKCDVLATLREILRDEGVLVS